MFNPTRRARRALLSGSVFLLLSAIVPARAESPEPKWEVEMTENGARHLNYIATVSLLGKQIPIGLTFRCDLTETEFEHGTLGFDLYIKNVEPLESFHFEDFEGPDAAASGRKLLHVAVLRKGSPPLNFDFAPSGSIPSERNFYFGIADVTTARSPEKELLQALANGAETLELSITDSRDPKVKLEVTVPVYGKEKDFKAMLEGLK